MQDFPPNSNKARETDQPREPIQRVTSAEAIQRKRGLGHKFKDTFIGGDIRGVGEHVFFGVVVPAVRDMLYDALQDGFQRMIYGESARPRTGGFMGTNSNVGHVAYNRMSTAGPPKQSQQRTLSRGARARHNFNELVIPSAQEANEVIDRMYDMLSRYGRVSQADLYELTGIQGSHTDEKWGWTDLRGAKARRLPRGGYLLDLPEPEAFV